MAATVAYPKSFAAERGEHSLAWHERAALAIGIFEIPLQIDKYLMFHERDADLGAVAGINLSVTTLCLVYLYAAWILKAVIQPRKTKATSIQFGLPMLAYLLAVTLSALAARVPSLAAFDLALLLQAYAIFFYVANRITTKEEVSFFLSVLAAAILLQSLFIMGLSAMGDAAVGQVYTIGPLQLSVWDDGRPAGTVFSAVVVASLLALMWLPVATFLLTSNIGRDRWLIASATIAGFLAILLTQTRGAIITMLFGSLLIGTALTVRRWLPRWAIHAAIFFALLGAYPMMQTIKNRVTGDDRGSAEARKHLGAIAAKAISREPLFGGGAGNCHIICQDIANSGLYRSEWYYTVHCKYLVVWIETGIAGLITFMLVLGSGIYNGIRAWRGSDRVLATLGLALAAAIAGHMVHMLVDVFNSRSQVQLLWAMLGIAAAVAKIARDRQTTPARSRSKLVHAS